MKLPQAPENILFLDIETVPEATGFSLVSEQAQDLFAANTACKRKVDDLSAGYYYDLAGIWAEFRKIICISVGYLTTTTNGRRLRVCSFFSEENELLV
tara:strand:- start:1734 stop:2027 length:294 start_codon:yes stop_codon:yes gene_type:complete